MSERPAILYIEDNHDNQRLVRRVMEARGYQVVVADDGMQGLAAARAGNPALILVDINIPGLDGFETTTRLRTIDHLRGVPIVALTADVREGTRERSLVAGCDGYLTKPIDPRALPAQLAEFMAGRRETVSQAVETDMLREYSQKLVERLERQVRDLSAANTELQELDRLKSQFLATMSHELRTPMTAILGYIDLFERKTLGPLSVAQTQAVEVVGRNARLLSRILNNLLYLQEVRSTEVHRTPSLIHEMLRTLVDELQPLAIEGGVALTSTIAPVAVFAGDGIGLSQALRALIDNAVKYTPRGGRVHVAAVDSASRVIVRIEDSGIGIAPEHHQKIFVPFYQVDGSLSRPYSGAGLGLAIARHVIDAHEGQLTLASIPGRGSVFTVVLPRINADPGIAPPP